MITTATFSKCRKYRFALERIWDTSKGYVMFIGLNPSTANETENDPTIIRCINFAKSWGYGGVCMTNLFAYCATQPDDMKAQNSPIGADNDMWLSKIAKDASVVVAAWGNDGAYLGRSKEVKNIIFDLHCLQLNQTGEPAHPLYLNAKLIPKPIYI